jgi:prolyl-tRNA synthetase
MQAVVVDHRDARPGDKQYHWEQKGVPFRLEVGPRDVEAGVAVLKHRLDRAKETVPLAQLDAAFLRQKLDAAHTALFAKAKQFQEAHTRRAGSYDELKAILEKDGGFVRCFFKPDRAVEKRVKDETKATVRCILLEGQSAPKGTCIVSGAETDTEVLFAQAY